MCGRYFITTPPEAIRRLFRYADQPNFPPRHNIAPTQPVPIVRIESGERCFALVRWGLIPAWAKDPKGFSLLINARAESVNDKPAFRNAMKRRRCLFPADGFYEWKGEGGAKSNTKRPFLARPRDGGPMAFAGLWETWTGPNGEEMETAAIVTVAANAEMGAIHHRAPAILAPEMHGPWLDCAGVDALAAAALLRPAPDGTMEVYPVSTAVNRVANDSPALVEPASVDDVSPEPAAAPRRKPQPAPDDRQGSLF